MQTLRVLTSSGGHTSYWNPFLLLTADQQLFQFHGLRFGNFGQKFESVTVGTHPLAENAGYAPVQVLFSRTWVLMAMGSDKPPENASLVSSRTLFHQSAARGYRRSTAEVLLWKRTWRSSETPADPGWSFPLYALVYPGWNQTWKKTVNHDYIGTVPKWYLFFFFFKFLLDTCPFVGPLIPLFWTSGDISSGFQSQSGFCLICTWRRHT